MVSIHEFDSFYHSLDGDSLIAIGSESINLSLSPSGSFSPHEVYFPSHWYFDKVSLSCFMTSIPNPTEDYYSYLPILKQLEEGSHMHVGGLVEVDISDDLKDPKIIYIGDILNEYEHDLDKSFFIECHEIFAFGYTDMPGLYPNLIVHNIVTYLMPN